MELYLWHSRRVTAPMRVDGGVLSDMVWRPLADIDVAEVFAFGRPWIDMAEHAGFRCEDRLGVGGRPWGSPVAGRRVAIYRLESGQRLVVSHQLGYAGPPGADDTRRLREVLAPE